MDGVGRTVAGQKRAIQADTYLGEMPLEPRDRRVVEHLSTVSGDKHQVADQAGDGMPFLAETGKFHLNLAWSA